MSRVYQAWDEVLERDVAVKVMYEHLTEDEEFVQRFIQEAKALAKISHPHFVQIHDVGHEGSIYYMVMELMSGPTLWQILRKKRVLEPEEAIPIMIQVLKGIGRAHQLGIIHRDIKPTNIMYSNDGRWKLMDLGASKLLSTFSDLTKQGMVIGTAQYYSPEQAKGEEATNVSDLYSAGIVLYQILTGRLPFTGRESFAIAMKHINEPPPHPRKINPNLPDPICNVLFKALAKDPNDRYQSAEEMINALEKVQQNLIEETEFTTNEEEEVADLSFESEDEGFENKDEKSEFPQETSSQSVQTSFEEAVDSDKPKKQKKSLKQFYLPCYMLS